MPDMRGAENADFGAVAGIRRRLPWGSAVLIIGALSVLSWAIIIGLVAAARAFG
jgi:hypothetical protein